MVCSHLLLLTGVFTLFNYVVQYSSSWLWGGFQSPCLVLEPAHGGGNGSRSPPLVGVNADPISLNLVVCQVLVSIVDITEITSAEVSVHQVMFTFLITWLARHRLRCLTTWRVGPSLVMWPSHSHVPLRFWSHGLWHILVNSSCCQRYILVDSNCCQKYILVDSKSFKRYILIDSSCCQRYILVNSCQKYILVDSKSFKRYILVNSSCCQRYILVNSNCCQRYILVNSSCCQRYSTF